MCRGEGGRRVGDTKSNVFFARAGNQKRNVFFALALRKTKKTVEDRDSSRWIKENDEAAKFVDVLLS